jgi:hypothetical protein
MFRSSRLLVLTALCLVCLAIAAMRLGAQPADPSGHWIGAIHVPDREVAIEVDLAKSAAGLAGTFSNPARNVKGFPLVAISVDGRVVRFTLKATSGGGTFESTLADDAKTMAGKFYTSTPQGDYAIPFTLSRDGAARFEAPATNPPIAPAFEGTWKGTLDAEGTPVPVVLLLRNDPNGTASGHFVLAKDSVEVPIASIVVKDGALLLDVKSSGSSYAGSVNSAGTAIVGTWTEGAIHLPLVLERVAPGKK